MTRRTYIIRQVDGAEQEVTLNVGHVEARAIRQFIAAVNHADTVGNGAPVNIYEDEAPWARIPLARRRTG